MRASLRSVKTSALFPLALALIFTQTITSAPSASAAATFTVNGTSVTGSLNYIYSSMTGGNKYTFDFTGSDWATIKVKLYGGGGGNAKGAAGGYVEGIIDVTAIPSRTFTIVVGGSGTDGNSSGGYNGGGSGWDWGGGVNAGGGGGATDLRLTWTSVTDYANANRVLVAAGGGGGTGNGGATGGSGAYPTGSSSASYGGFTASGGTQSAGGSPSGSVYSSAALGSFGLGGSGYGGANNGVDSEWNGGGGGGYYGGAAHSYHGGGGGGSSYYNSSYITNFAHTTGGGSAKQTAGSASIQILTLGTSIPDAPTVGTATAIDSSTATISFTAPTNNGGATITSYSVISTPESVTATINQAGSGTITISNLTPGSSYTFRVRATNSIGNSAYSSSSNSITLPRATTIIGLVVARNPTTFRTSTGITVNANVAGKVTFLNSKKTIAGCLRMPVTTSVTCNWKPMQKGVIEIQVIFVPTNTARNSTPAPQYMNVFVGNRTTLR
jgi:hypothetical protein